MKTTTSILLLLLTVPHPTYAWHEILGPGDKIIFKKDYRLAPSRSITIFKKNENNNIHKCGLIASHINKRTILIKSGKQYEIKSTEVTSLGQFLYVNVEKGEFGFSLTYGCYNCEIDQLSSDCGGLVTIIHQKPVEF